ncbi:hypothetical protein ACET6E_17405 [Aeromonas caviae]|uniref:hypothetical protein n=1 Tax=Aeromonas TaxID=642 RepID=UPI0025B712FF|nr:hypothetical protein [Aeromonas caviae]
MSITFDVVIDSDDYSVDMTSGLETLQGASEVTRQIAETLLTEHVPQHLTSASKVRTKLRRTFSGSYGQIYSLELDDDELNARYRRIGKKTFLELMSYFINEALYLETPTLSKKTDLYINNMMDLEEKLIEQLRKSSLKHLHAASVYSNKSVKLRHRNSDFIIASVNKSSYGTLKPKTDRHKVTIVASITRFNINTGNGRLLIKGTEDTVAFGFPSKYKEVKHAAKKKFSSNLDNNNGLPNDVWATLTLEAHTLKLNDGQIIKYLIEKVL